MSDLIEEYPGEPSKILTDVIAVKNAFRYRLYGIHVTIHPYDSILGKEHTCRLFH